MLYSDDHSISGWSEQGLQIRKSKYQRIFSKLRLPSDKLLLDLGCGSGVYSRMLTAAGYTVIGVDYAYNVLHEAKKRDHSGNGSYLCGDLYSLPFKDNCFGHILCIGVFQSLAKPMTALAELRRILAPGATLVLMTLNSLQVKCLIDSVLGRTEILMVEGAPIKRLETYNPFAFKNKLMELGFKVLYLKPLIIIPVANMIAKAFASLMERIPFLAYASAIEFIAVAKKECSNQKKRFEGAL